MQDLKSLDDQADQDDQQQNPRCHVMYVPEVEFDLLNGDVLWLLDEQDADEDVVEEDSSSVVSMSGGMDV